MPKSFSELPSSFVVESILKRDVFGEIAIGHLDGRPEFRVIRRRVVASKPWARPLAWHLANREIRALKKLEGVSGVPHLLCVDRDALYRSFIEGAPLHVAKPIDNDAYFHDAKRLLRAIHDAGIAHNDLAKPQNWLITPDGHAAVVDLQLAACFRNKGRLFRLLAREDLRHLLKQKRSFCKTHLTPAERRLLATKSLPARLWMRSFKPLYNGVTRGVFDWSDGEGTQDRLDTEGKAIGRALDQDRSVAAHALSLFPYPKRQGVGIYAFVEAHGGKDRLQLQKRLRATLDPAPDLLQVVEALPRDADGRIREDLLRLIAINQVDRLEAVSNDGAALGTALAIASERLNWTDRRLRST